MNPLTVPTNYGYVPNKRETHYSKKRDSSEIIEFKNELTYWSNRITEISTHYRSSLLPGQIQELAELKTKINHVKESITPGRKTFISPLTSPTATPLTSPPESPRSIAIRKKLPPIPIKNHFKPDPPSTKPPLAMTKSAPTLIPAPRYRAPHRNNSGIITPIRSDSLRKSKNSNNSTATNSSSNSIDDESFPNSRRNSRSRSHRNSWDQKKPVEVKPSSAPKSFYFEKNHPLPARRRSSRKNTDPTLPLKNDEPISSEVQLGLALIKAVKYLDTNPLSPRSRRRAI